MRAFQFSTLAVATAFFPLVAGADNLLKNASFEQPKVEKRTDERKGGDPVQTEAETTWTHYLSMDPAGKVTVGLTNELSRTGTSPKIELRVSLNLNMPSPSRRARDGEASTKPGLCCMVCICSGRPVFGRAGLFRS